METNTATKRVRKDTTIGVGIEDKKLAGELSEATGRSEVGVIRLGLSLVKASLPLVPTHTISKPGDDTGENPPE